MFITVQSGKPWRFEISQEFFFCYDQYYNKDQDLQTGTLVPAVFLAIFLQERAREKQGSKGREKTSKTSGNSVVN